MKPWKFLPIAVVLLAFSATAQVGQIITFPATGTAVHCTENATLQARMDGSQNAGAIAALVCGLVADGVWTKLDTLWVLATNSEANAALNWKSTSFGLTKNGTCTWTPNTGYTGNTTTPFCWFTTGFTPSTNGVNYTQNDASVSLCDFTGNNGAATIIMGGYGATTTNRLSVALYLLGSQLGSANINSGSGAATAWTAPGGVNKGIWSFNRTASTVGSAYLNGALQTGTALLASTGLPNGATALLANNANGTIGTYSPDKVGMFAIGGNLGALSTNLYSRMHSYFAAVGAAAGC